MDSIRRRRERRMLLDHLYTEPLTLVRKAPKILAFHYRPMASFDYETEYTQA